MSSRILFLLFLSVLLVSTNLSLQAQTSTNSSGGTGTGSGGVSSYSLGQVVYHAYSSGAGTVTEGVQQVFTEVSPCPEITAAQTEGCVGEMLAQMTADVPGGTWSVHSDIGTVVDQSGVVLLGTDLEVSANQDTVVYSVNGCADTVIITTGLTGSYCECGAQGITVSGQLTSDTFVAVSTLTSSGLVAADSSVVFQAGLLITLEAGFHAESGSAFQAHITDCVAPTGPLPGATASRVEPPKMSAPKTSSRLTSRVWPNPFQESFTLEVEVAEASVLSVFLHSLHGAQGVPVVRDQTVPAGTYQLSINRPDLPAGVYVLALWCNGERHAHRVVCIRK